MQSQKKKKEERERKEGKTHKNGRDKVPVMII